MVEDITGGIEVMEVTSHMAVMVDLTVGMVDHMVEDIGD
jgi:hypothetical protein